jgi:hypothetical protein
MPSIDFKRVRARVTELWSEKPVTDEALVQQVVATPGGRREPHTPPWRLWTGSRGFGISTCPKTSWGHWVKRGRVCFT